MNMKKAFSLMITALLVFSVMTTGFAGSASATSAEDLAQQILGMQQEREDAAEGQSSDADQPAAPAQDADTNILEAASTEPEFDPTRGLEPGVFMYTATPIHPENQMGDSGGFNLKMEPGTKQTIEVMVSNTGSEVTRIGATVMPAFTNTNGVVQMDTLPYAADSSLQYHIEDLVTMETDVLELSPSETKPFRFEITMPEESFDGVVMGGLVLKREPSEAEMEASSGMGIVNVYSYVFGLRLSETDTVVEPEFELVDAFVNVRTAFGPAVKVYVRNPVALFAQQVSMSFQVYKSDDMENPVLTHGRGAMEFAPNSTMYYNWRNNENLEDGDYVFKLQITYGDETFEFEKELKVEGIVAEEDVNPPALEVEAETTDNDDLADEAGEEEASGDE